MLNRIDQLVVGRTEQELVAQIAIIKKTVDILAFQVGGLIDEQPKPFNRQFVPSVFLHNDVRFPVRFRAFGEQFVQKRYACSVGNPVERLLACHFLRSCRLLKHLLNFPLNFFVAFGRYGHLLQIHHAVGHRRERFGHNLRIFGAVEPDTYPAVCLTRHDERIARAGRDEESTGRIGAGTLAGSFVNYRCPVNSLFGGLVNYRPDNVFTPLRPRPICCSEKHRKQKQNKQDLRAHAQTGCCAGIYKGRDF